ncbi:hypothetical protein M422DRAFT_164836 [Sphaerobolus stellatus SS14]|uniref:Uncharacterized protein n=1 Tax=Sphaerobolus stellatus (strain SS14) TaxID=990650 RepID=A0A0C9UUN6_SPHS4|nr:hypothetical protein M422DRAFT_164836 [Sphaerobolus stellatus SS14]
MHDFPVESTADTLSLYTVYMCNHIKPSSVASYLSGIQNELEPFFPNIRSIRKSVLVQKTLLGCKRLRHSEPKWRKALELSDLNMLVQTVGSSESHNDILFLAQVTSGFFGLNRLGELVWPDNRRLQLYTNVPIHTSDKIFDGVRVLIQAIHSLYDPVYLFKRYLKSRDSLFPGRPELWLRSDRSPPQRSHFISLFRRSFPSDISGHSLRLGGALALTLAGTPLNGSKTLADGRLMLSDCISISIRSSCNL